MLLSAHFRLCLNGQTEAPIITICIDITMRFEYEVPLRL